MVRKYWTFLLFTMLVFMEPVLSDIACSAQPVCVTFAIDRTLNINEEQRKQMAHFILNVTAAIPLDSEGHLIYVNEERNEVATSVVENEKVNYTYFYGQEDWEPTGYIISAKALEQQVNVCFNASAYTIKTEVFFLLVSDLTKLQGISPVLLRKKETFVIVFGSRIPIEFQSLASSEDHIHIIKDSDDVTTAVDIVSKQLCKACSTQPVCVSFAIDRTINMNEEQQKMSYFIKNMTATIPEGSEGHLIYVNDERNKVAAFVVENQRMNFTNVNEQDWKPTGYIKSAIVLAQAANMCHTASDNEGKAEVNFLLVSGLTKLQGFPPLLLRKKTFVIVFGLSIPNELRRLASSGDHTHLIKDPDNVTAVVDLVSKQVCKDIVFPHIPDVEVFPKETDSREETVHIVLVVLSIVVVVTSLLLFVCHKKKTLCFTPSGTCNIAESKKMLDQRNTEGVFMI